LITTMVKSITAMTNRRLLGTWGMTQQSLSVALPRDGAE
jgi:hypothetical protein